MATAPVVAITLGDPCGIGPEVTAKALAPPKVRALCCPLVVGNARIFQEALALAGVPLQIHEVEAVDVLPDSPEGIAVLDPHNLNAEEITPGRVSAAAGRASMEWAELAARLCLAGQVQAMATAPVHKEAVWAAGYKEIGHTEVFQKMTQAPQVATMLISGTLRVVHLTTHLSLRDACDAVTRDNVLTKLRLTHETFQVWGFPLPSIGVAALNPHGSDGGLLGNEEETAIAPAVEEAIAQGIQATGPVPSDIVFHHAIQGRYDVVLCMYHDQGHIPIKVHGFEESISVNLGLPFIRTSVDHGTAFDIAGKGKAQATSMAEAITLAARLARGDGLPR